MPAKVRHGGAGHYVTDRHLGFQMSAFGQEWSLSESSGVADASHSTPLMISRFMLVPTPNGPAGPRLRVFLAETDLRQIDGLSSKNSLLQLRYLPNNGLLLSPPRNADRQTDEQPNEGPHGDRFYNAWASCNEICPDDVKHAKNQPADNGQCDLSAKHPLCDSQSGVKVLLANQVVMVHA